MKALVTGAAGFIGSQYVRALLSGSLPGTDDVQVTVLDKLRSGKPGDVYHLGGGAELTNKQLTARLLEACGAGWEQVDYVADRKGHDRRYSIDISKARDELGYSPCVSFDEGLASTIAWYGQNRSWRGQLKAKAATT